MFILSNELILTPSKQGGSKTVSSTHKHTTQSHTLTINEMPSHHHTTEVFNTTIAPSLAGSGSVPAWPMNSTQHKQSSCVGGGGSHSHGDTGNATFSTNVVQPYITTYFYRRTN